MFGNRAIHQGFKINLGAYTANYFILFNPLFYHSLLSLRFWVVKMPLIFLQKYPIMHTRNTIKLAHMTLGLRIEIFDPVDVISLVYKQFRMIDTAMHEFRYTQHVITSPADLLDDTVRLNFALNNRVNVAD